MKYILYATDKHGDGHVQKIGTYEDLEDIEIRVGMFAKDVVMSIERENDEGDII